MKREVAEQAFDIIYQLNNLKVWWDDIEEKMAFRNDEHLDPHELIREFVEADMVDNPHYGYMFNSKKKREYVVTQAIREAIQLHYERLKGTTEFQREQLEKALRKLR